MKTKLLFALSAPAFWLLAKFAHRANSLRSALFLLLWFVVYTGTAQVPQGFNYQAIARDGSGNPISNATIMVKLSILSDTTGFYASSGGTYIWEEEQTNIKTNAFGLFTVVFGNPTATKKQGSAVSFSAIDWAKSPLYIGTKIANPTDYKNMGSAKLWSVPYSMVTDSTKALLKGSKLSVVSSNDLATDALFEVKRKDGQTVFAVYPDAVNIYVPRTAKGTKGGFAIGGFDQVKTGPQDYFRVTPDSVRIYIDKTPTIVKGATKGGFAIGGFDQVKGRTQDLLTVSNDSIRMYINDLPGKGSKGGFAIGGFDQVKGLNAKFLNVETSSTGIINPSQNKVLWYPIKNAFLVGKVLIEKPDSVGVNSFATGFESKAKGQYSQAMGYKAIARGDYSTSIGKNSVVNGPNSYAFGDGVIVQGQNSYAFGNNSRATGTGSYAFGENAISSNSGSFALGTNCSASGISSLASGYNASVTGAYSFSLGYSTACSGYASTSIGYQTLSSGYASSAIGYQSTVSTGGAYALAVGYQSYASYYTALALGCGDTATGESSLAMGRFAKASGLYAISIGTQTKSSGMSSASIGRDTKATGDQSLAMGFQSESSGGNSIAIGTNCLASGIQSVAIGTDSKAKGVVASAIGVGVITKPYAALSVGEYNDTSICYNAITDDSRDPIFMIGNGSYYSHTRSNAMTVLKSGNTGIGVLSPSSKLDVDGCIRSTTYAAPTSGVGIEMGYIAANNSGYIQCIDRGTSTFKDLRVGGNTLPQADNLWTLGSSASRWKSVWSVNGAIQTSDLRLKKDIQTLNYGLESIIRLKPVSFVWKDDSSDKKHLGLVAQDVSEIINEVVEPGSDPDKTLGINYAQLVPVLIKGMQEQQQQIESTKQENDQLKNKLHSLEEKMEQIEELLIKSGVK